LIGFFSSWYSATKKHTDDVADLMSSLDSGWVILGKSDIIPVDLAEATVATGHQHLDFMLLPMIPIL
jgi:hypothetical protein